MALAIGLFCAISISAGADEPAKQNVLSPDEIAEGWILLFDGESMFGWTAASDADWRVEEGTIVVGSGKAGLLHTNAQFADYELKVDFRSDEGTNSGVFLRTLAEPKNPKDGCYELNIADFETNPYPTGSLVARGESAKVKENHDSREWQTFEARLVGGDIQIKLDGKLLYEFHDDKPVRRGRVGLQLNQGKVAFRNVKLKPLSQKPLFNGRDLAGWRMQPQRDGVFVVADELLHVKGGPAQLESVDKFGDFTFQAAVRSNEEGSNSGVFFRSIPGQMTNGYECQLQNRYGPGGEKNLVDCGTGGICRRQRARRIVAKDGEWFHLTLVVDGPHMAAWVDGYQTCDWTDDRAADENPRKGKRLEAGTLILQAHDESTDFDFREIRAAEMHATRASAH